MDGFFESCGDENITMIENNLRFLIDSLLSFEDLAPWIRRDSFALDLKLI